MFHTVLCPPSDAGGCHSSELGNVKYCCNTLKNILWTHVCVSCRTHHHFECSVQCAPAVCSVPLHIVCYSVDCALHFDCIVQCTPAVWGSPAARTIPCFPAHFVRLPLRLSPLLHPTYTCCILREREKMRKKTHKDLLSSGSPPPQCPKAKVLFLNMSSFILQVLVSVRSSCGISPSDHSTFVVQNLISANCTNQPQLCFLYKLCK